MAIVDIPASAGTDFSFQRCRVHTIQPIVIKVANDATSHRSVFAGTLVRSEDGRHVEHLSERVEGNGVHDNNFTWLMKGGEHPRMAMSSPLDVNSRDSMSSP